MRTIVIAIGNPLRGDDGLAHIVADRLENVAVRHVHQLTPELAAELVDFDRVIFVDADATVSNVRIEPVDQQHHSAAPFTHFAQPTEIVALAKALYGFAGEALLCRIPAKDFEPSIAVRSQPELLRATDLLSSLLAAGSVPTE